MSKRYEIITICGSMRYFNIMLSAAEEYTTNGFIVLMPYNAEYIGKPSDEIKTMLDDMHFTKIRMSDSILVVGIHRGESTTREIEYAKTLGLEIREWNY